MEFKLAPVAKSDVLEITDYYAEISTELAERFVSELESTLHGLCLQPGVGSRRYAHFLADQSLRVWQLDCFPFCCSIASMALGSRCCASCTNDATFPPI